MKKQISNLIEKLRDLSGGVKQTETTAGQAIKAKRRQIVKARPASLEQRYYLLDDEAVGDRVFQRMRQNIFKALDSVRGSSSMKGGVIFREAGRISPGRPYFYLKPAGEAGWLFERSGAGWTISQAEKIVGQDLFLRQGEAWDMVSLFGASDSSTYPRVKSPQTGGDLLSFAVYEQKLLSTLGLTNNETRNIS